MALSRIEAPTVLAALFAAKSTIPCDNGNAISLNCSFGLLCAFASFCWEGFIKHAFH
jgi:hypothetical protein